MARFSVSALAVLAAALLLASSAGAVDPLSVTSTVPADGAFRPPTPSGGISFQVVVAGVPADANISVTVSSSPATGADGVTLSTDKRVDFFFLAPTGAPGGYSALSDPGPNPWSADVGTYYWQLIATWTDAAGVFHSAAGKVERLSIGTPPATPAPTPTPGPGGAAARTSLRMSSLDAPFYVRRLIRRQTRRTPVGLHNGCRRLNSRSFRCRPTWRDSRNVYSATATFTHARSAGRVVARATATGRRASRQCTRTRTVKACGRAFRWRATIAARPLGSTR
jgi:hypothetical protein